MQHNGGRYATVAQVEALKRYRTGGEQRVTVKHVTVMGTRSASWQHMNMGLLRRHFEVYHPAYWQGKKAMIRTRIFLAAVLRIIEGV